jgi:hypothetical protein
MAGVTAQGATFLFRLVSGSAYGAVVAGLSVQTPTAEIADMTAGDTPRGYQVLVPTGDIASGGAGTVTVDYLSPGKAGLDWQSVVGSVGTLIFQSRDHDIVRRVVLESATAEARSGELVRGTLRFRMTDYTGS